MGNHVCHRGCEVLPSNNFPVQEELTVDWEDESSVHQRSAINSLHNYALGKFGEKNLPKRPKTRKRSQSLKHLKIKFAEQPEEIHSYLERSRSE